MSTKVWCFFAVPLPRFSRRNRSCGKISGIDSLRKNGPTPCPLWPAHARLTGLLVWSAPGAMIEPVAYCQRSSLPCRPAGGAGWIIRRPATTALRAGTYCSCRQILSIVRKRLQLVFGSLKYRYSRRKRAISWRPRFACHARGRGFESLHPRFKLKVQRKLRRQVWGLN